MQTFSRRHAIMGAASTLAGSALAQASPARAVTGTPLADLAFVAPELRPAARQLLRLTASMPEISLTTLPAFRAMASSLTPSVLAAPAVQKQIVTGDQGAKGVAVYVINSDPAVRKPAILHMHGGGFVVGSARDGMADLQKAASELDCVVVSVDYRLAPESTFTESIGDNYAALRWLHLHALELGVDPARIAVEGDSAGGGHAALLAIMARDRGEVPLVAQVLTYPMLDDRTGSTVHPQSPIGTIFWTEALNRFGWRCFLGQAPGTVRVPAEAVPARHVDLSRLPPTFIGVGSVDLFVDENVAYARALIDSGVPTELIVVPGAFHGFDAHAPSTTIAKVFAASRAMFLRRAFTDKWG